LKNDFIIRTNLTIYPKGNKSNPWRYLTKLEMHNDCLMLVIWHQAYVNITYPPQLNKTSQLKCIIL
jgi:hypothetical protein